MPSLKQTDRLMQFSTPLGKDVLVIEGLEGAEGISRLFEFNLELLADAGTSVDPKSIVGSKVNVAILLGDVTGARYISGIVASFEQMASDDEFDYYHARVVPGMWQLTLSANCRVFQDKTVLDIVKSVIGEYGLTISDQTSASYKQLSYCTQYSETDFQFVSRILEESGIFYWFEHTDQDNKIVLGDGRTAYQDCPLSASFPFSANAGAAVGTYSATIDVFTSTATMVSGKHSTAEYNLKDFAREDGPDKNSSSTYGKNAFDQYLYPVGSEGYANGDASTSSSLETLFLETRAQASDAVSEVYRGGGNVRSLCAGYTFTLSKNPRSAWNRKYLLTTVAHQAGQTPPYRPNEKGLVLGYTNKFTAVSSDIVFKPAQTFTKPRIYGPQTALVVGPSGEEIYLDKLGRAKVQFFWDKAKSRGSDADSTWVRVAQGWAGNGWGSYFWPRINDEVVVQFLNGDPDNPVITGSVYNGKNTPKYSLPDNGTRSGIVTRSSKGGSAATANELRFEDKMGSEEIYIHAEKDMNTSIENNRAINVYNNDSLTVKNNQTEQVGLNFNRQIKSNAVEKVGGNSDLGIGGNLTESVGGNHGLNVGSNQSISVGSAYSLNANNTIYINGGMSVVIQAGMELSLVASGNFVTIGPSGVAISGTMVLINSGGAAGSGSAGSVGSPQSPGSPDSVDDGSAGGSGGSASSSGGSSSSGSGGGAAGVKNVLELSSAGGLGGVAGAAGQDADSAQQAAAQGAQQAAQQAAQAAGQAQQAANQAAQAAQQAVNQVAQQEQQTVQQAQNAVQQAQQEVNNATAQGRAAAQGAMNQAQQQLQQAKQAAAQAVQQAQQQAQQAQQAAQNAANQAKQAAQQAQQEAQAAATEGTQAAQQAEKQAQQEAAAAKQAAQQAQQQAQQVGKQVQQAASGAAQQAQQAAKAAEQSASQAASQAARGF